MTVVGPGRMGPGIAEYLAMTGCHVDLLDVKERTTSEEWSSLTRALSYIKTSLDSLQKEGLLRLSPEIIASRIQVHRGYGDSLFKSDLIVEALPEQLEIKKEFYRNACKTVREDAILTSTTSTLSPTRLSKFVSGRKRFLVAHWLNPAELMPLVEVVPSRFTAEEITRQVIDWLEAIGKVPIRCADRPGFASTRILVLLLNEAVRLYQEHVASPADIDKAVIYGLGLRLASGQGPLEFIDYSGVDMLYRASQSLCNQLKDTRFSAHKVVREMIKEKHLGIWAKKGFKDYNGVDVERLVQERIHSLARALKQTQLFASPPTQKRHYEDARVP